MGLAVLYHIFASPANYPTNEGCCHELPGANAFLADCTRAERTMPRVSGVDSGYADLPVRGRCAQRSAAGCRLTMHT